MKVAIFLLFAVLLLPCGAQPAFTETTSSGPPVVIFDQGHGQRFAAEDRGPLGLARLTSILQEQKLRVGVLAGPLTPARLAASRAVIISGPFTPLTRDDIERLSAFMENGGRLCLMLHIAEPAAALMERLGIEALGVALAVNGENQSHPATDFAVSDLDSNQLFQGLLGFTVYGSWALEVAGSTARIIARTDKTTWIDDNRDGIMDENEVRPYGMVATGIHGKGAFMVFGDDAIFQNRFLDPDNRKLARNLAAWLAGNGD